MVKYSVVLPLHNEEENCGVLYERLTKVMRSLDTEYEIIFVDDGSTDKTLKKIISICEDDESVFVVELSRNFGQENAICAGLSVARGEQLILMDGDLQDPPELIPRLIEKKEEGYNVVYTVKDPKSGSLLRNFLTRSFYWIMWTLALEKIPQGAGTFSIFDRIVASSILQMGDRKKFISGLRSHVGFRQSSFSYERSERSAGTSKSLYELLRMGLNAFFSFSIFPLRVVSLLCSLCGVAGFVWIFFAVLSANHSADNYVLFFMLQGSVVCFSIAIIAEYVGRIDSQVKGRPEFIVSKIYNKSDKTRL